MIRHTSTKKLTSDTKKDATPEVARATPEVAPATATATLTFAAFARACGVHKSTIGRSTKPGGPLHEAVTDGRIVLDSPAVDSWLHEHGLSRSVFGLCTDQPEEPDQPDDAPDDPGDQFAGEQFAEAVPLEKLAHLSLVEITQRFGHISQFYEHVRARKEHEQAEKARFQRERLERKLIPATLIEDAIGMLNGLARQLLSDTAKTLASRLAQGSFSVEDAEAMIRDGMSQVLTKKKYELAGLAKVDDGVSALKDPADPSAARDPRREATQAVSIAERLISQSIAERVADQFQPSKVNADRDFDSIVRSVLVILDQEFARAKREIYHGEVTQ